MAYRLVSPSARLARYLPICTNQRSVVRDAAVAIRADRFFDDESAMVYGSDEFEADLAADGRRCLSQGA
jgi:hypothetical protein